MRVLLRTAVLPAALCILACSNDDESASGDGSSSSPPAEWMTMLTGDWSLEAGSEGYTCVRKTIEEDVYINAFRPIAPLGTHHTLFTIVDDPDPEDEDGTFECSVATNGREMLFGSGVGTDTVEFPPGVAMKLERGQTVLLNLHLFNTDTESLQGRSGLEIRPLAEAEVEHEAEIVLAGKIGGLEIPPGEVTQTGECPMSDDSTIVAVFPHMHQLGVHLKATALPEGKEPRVLVDEPYSFEEQRYYAVDPVVELAKDEKVEVECQYQNPTADTVYFGDSSLTEMCFAGLVRYPKSATGLTCTSGSRGDGGGFVIEGAPCAADGDPGNEEEVGRHCTADGGECGDLAPICLASFVDGDFGNFCTKMCSSDDACGAGAVCVGGGVRAVCMPSSCAETLASLAGDAGADASADGG